MTDSSRVSGSLQPRSARLPNKRLAAFFRMCAIVIAPSALVFSIPRLGHNLDLTEWFFIGSFLVESLAEGYWILAPYLNRWLARPSTSEDILVSLYTPRHWFYENRRIIRLILHVLVILSGLIMTVHVFRLQTSISGALAMSFFAYSLIFLAWVVSEAVRHFKLSHLGWVGFLVSIIFGLCIYFAIQNVTSQTTLLLLTGFGMALALIVFLAQQIEVGEQVWADIIRDLAVQFVDTKNNPYDLSVVVNQIGIRLGYERVSVLEPTSDGGTLTVIAEYGNYRHVIGTKIPSEQGITGRAFQTLSTCGSNDVRKCSYYQRLADSEFDNTLAEIAIPIKHRGQVFGILDIQSKSAMAYGPGDLRSLEVISRILGAAQAVQKTDILLDQANKVWSEVSQGINSENELFEELAGFARSELAADLVVYYHLSPTGFPTDEPRVEGDLFFRDRMNSPINNLNSPLFNLIREWKPVFEQQVGAGGAFIHQTPPESPGFAEREGIKSACFIPIGTPSERMAVVILNYRHPRVFDSLFQLMVLGFAQAFATVLARESYRELLFRGLGRPELGVHNILARYGLKDGITQEGSEILQPFSALIPEDNRSRLVGLFQEVDTCLIELRAQSAKVDPGRDLTLREVVEDMTRKMKDHVPYNRSVRFIKDLDPRVERESHLTRLALYRTIDEAINNAIFHGNASEIKIQTRRLENVIALSVASNGGIFPANAMRLRSRSGIFSILDELKTQFNAQTSIEPQEGGGAVIMVEIPVLPEYRTGNRR